MLEPISPAQSIVRGQYFSTATDIEVDLGDFALMSVNER